ncbi:putative dehydrogenase [Agromyces ramosus]|uniref:Putative dehydrogenase n=1 Tax=Agromyces ramosus TaxID=33879 RepID=A0A4V2EZG7_9MICO|nr:Gfo/Idh/MocA family oxidoreductase [Agromyces ramosus]RZS66430.1 putative dehydrogenase [Agromyces ramosus]
MTESAQFAPLGVGVVGAGMWARTAHIPMHTSPGPTVLTGVWARATDARERLQADGVPVFDTFDALLEASEAVDFAVPPTVQSSLAMRAVHAGRHVLLEKPSAIDPADAWQLADAVAASGVVSALTLTRRFHPVVRRFLETVNALEAPPTGVAGVHVHGGFLTGGFVAEPSGWRDELGALVDLGPHLLDLAEQVAGPILRVKVRDHGGYTAIDADHASGALGQYAVSGSVRTPAATTLTAYGPAGREELDTRGLDMAPAFDQLREEFARAARTGSPVTVDADRGAELAELIDACRRSLAEQASFIDVHRKK